MILVTGGFGLVGSNLVRKLAKDGEKVIVLDLSVDKNSEFFNGIENLHFEEGNVTNKFALAKIFNKYQISCVVHAAANTNGVFCKENPTEAIESNAIGTLNLLEFCRIHDVEKFVYISSGSVFGLQETTDPILESTLPTAMNTYATTKRLSEEIAHCYRVNYGIDTTSVRISWVFGPTPTLRKPRWNQGPIPYYFWSVLTENKLIQESGLDFLANFTHVDDVSEGISKIIATPDAPPYINLSSEQLFSNRDIVNFIKEKCPDCEVKVGDGVQPFVQQAPIRGPLVSEYKEQIGYKPIVDFKQALNNQFDWMKEQINKG